MARLGPVALSVLVVLVAPRVGACPPGPPLSPRLARDAADRALAASGLAADLTRLEGLRVRARTAALVPQLALRASRSVDQSLRLTPTLEDPDRYSLAGGAGYTVDARLTFQLERLVFDADELAVHRLRQDRLEAARKLVERVVAVLERRERARVRLGCAAPGVSEPPAEGQAGAGVELIVAETELSVLTGGWTPGPPRTPPAPR
ncbi:MAG: hypothetical protein FJ104_02940 [Deltaproteobacteria bacterium]|nr:hypothetical protein [Deltaproteobacteria bacterium]